MKHTFKRIAFLFLAAVMIVTVLPVSVFAAEGDDGIVYHVRPVYDNNRNTISAEKYNGAESEHFQLLWGNKNNSYINDKWIQDIFDTYEACWQLYVEDLGMTSPAYSTWRDGDHEIPYKVNIIVWGTGLPGYHNDNDPNEWAAYGGIDAEGYGYMMCSRDAMASPALPHELGHVVQFAQGYNSWADGAYLGPWYEAIANWYREQYFYSDYYTAKGNNRTDFSYLILRAASLSAANGRAYYEAWPLLQYLTENPDELEGYGTDFVAKLLQNGSPSGFIYKMIEDQAEAPLDDTLGYFAAHMATLDFANSKSYKKNVADNGEGWDAFFWQQFYTMLEPVSGMENTYIVPTERAPQQAAYVVTPLTVTDGEVSVTLNGLSEYKGAGWKACIVTVKGNERTYSALFGDGETMKVNAADADEVYLTVAATPKLSSYVKYAAFTTEKEVSFDKKPRYPFEAVITGAKPSAVETVSTKKIKGSEHPNGGGFVAKTAKVADTVYVGPDAMVLGNTKITGDVRIEDHAIVMGSAKISGNALIDGYAIIAGNASIKGDVHIGDYAIVTGNANITGNAQVLESAFIGESFKLTDNGIAKGLALCLGSGSVSKTGVVDGDYFDNTGLKITSGTVKGYMPAFGDTNGSELKAYLRKLKGTDNLILGYDFDSTKDAMMSADLYSSTYVTVKGSEWGDGVYTFKDASQYLIVDGGVLSTNSDMQMKLRVRYDGGDGKLMNFEGDGGSLTVTPKNANGKLDVTLRVGDESVTLESKSEFPVGQWTDLVLTFTGGKIVLTIGSETQAIVETALRTADINAYNGILGGVSGAVDSLYFYSANVENVSTEIASKDEPSDTGSSSEGADTSAGTDAPAAEKSGCGSAMGGVSVTIALAAALVVFKKRK